jgi:hypothetical protein
MAKYKYPAGYRAHAVEQPPYPGMLARPVTPLTFEDAASPRLLCGTQREVRSAAKPG